MGLSRCCRLHLSLVWYIRMRTGCRRALSLSFREFWRAPGSLRSLRFVMFIRPRIRGRRVHSDSFRFIRGRAVVVGYIRIRLVHSDVPRRSL